MKKPLFLWLALVVLTTYSCKEKTFLNQDALPIVDGINVFQEDTFNVIATNLLRDSLITSDVNIIGLGECSQYPYLGPVRMDAALQFKLPKEQFILDGTNPEIDSVVIELPYADVYIDSIGGGTMQQLELYELSQNLDLDSVYYNFDDVSYGSTLLNHASNLSFDFNNHEDFNVVMGDTLSPRIRVRLSDDFVADMQNASSTAFLTSEDFINWFSGVYIKTQNTGANSLAYINALSSRLEVYYHNDEDSGLKASFPYYSENTAHYTRIHRTYDAQILNTTNNPNPLGEDWNYMTYSTGVKTQIEIPYIPSLEDYIINDAVIEFTATKPANGFPVLQFVFPRLIQDSFLAPTADYLYTLDYSGYLLSGYDEVTLSSGDVAYRYKLRVTQELTRAQQEKEPILMEVGGVEFDDVTSLPMCKNVIKVGGNNRTDDYKLKLKILYSKN